MKKWKNGIKKKKKKKKKTFILYSVSRYWISTVRIMNNVWEKKYLKYSVILVIGERVVIVGDMNAQIENGTLKMVASECWKFDIVSDWNTVYSVATE